MSNIDRRFFNKLLLTAPLSICPIRFISEAVARDYSTSKAKDLNYVQLNLYGAPARWNFDLILKPNEKSPFVPSGLIATQFDNIDVSDFRKTRYSYKLHNIDGHSMPPIWQHKLKTSKGEISPSTLLKNMLTIRGARMQSDGHELNNRKLVAPIPGGHSLTGLLAEKSILDFPIIQMESKFGLNVNAVGAYKSPTGIPQLNLGPKQDYISELYGFLEYEEQIFNTPRKDTIIDEAIASFSEKDFKISRSQLKRVINRNIKKIQKDYREAVKRYRDIIKRTFFDNTIKNVTNKRVPGFDIHKAKFLSELSHVNQIPESEFKKLTDGQAIAGPYSSEFGLTCNPDLRSLFQESEYTNLAEQFALTELCLKNDISQNFVLSLSPASNLRIEKQISLEHLRLGSNNSITVWEKQLQKVVYRKNFTFDTHQDGAIIELLGTTYFYHTMMSCLGELVTKLKAFGTFDNTIIHIASEFDRDPRIDQTGSDHGWEGVTTSVISGMIKGHQSIGNIYNESHGENTLHKHNGTWGQAAPVEELHGKTVNYEDILSSFCQVFKLRNLSPRSKPIFIEEGGQIKTTFTEFRNMERES